MEFIFSEAAKIGNNLQTQDCKFIYDLCGEFEPKFAGAAGSPQDIMYLACEMAHEALLWERERATAILNAVEKDGEAPPEDVFCRGWRSAADAARVELLDMLSGPEWSTANDN
jgi:hypothetical protein